MLRDEFIHLRRESAAFLAAINEMTGFAERLGQLDAPAVVAAWPWAAIRRVITVPQATWTGLTPGLLRANAAELSYEPRPGNDELEIIERYAARVDRFAAQYLANPSWGSRAVHDAARRRMAVKLPRARPEKLIRTGGAMTFTELEALVEAHRPRRELRGSRTATWNGAVEAVRSRLASQPVSTANRQHLSAARRYLEAAIDRELPAAGRATDPVEPTDHPLWEQHVNDRIKTTSARPAPPDRAVGE